MDKKKILANLTPLGLLPLATALTCVILATRGENQCPGHPNLPHFLIFAGALTFGLAIHNKVNKFVVIYGFPDDRPFTRHENQVLWMITKTRSFMTFCQVLLFIAGTVIVAPLASTIHPWNYDDPNHEYYCDYTLVMFSAIYFPSMWFFLILYGFAYALIKCFSARALELPWLKKLLRNLTLKNFHKYNLLHVPKIFVCIMYIL